MRKLIVALGTVVMLACSAAKPAASTSPEEHLPLASTRREPCQPTEAHMVPPQAVMDFIVGGASPRPTFASREAWAAGGNWIGNDVLWVSLPEHGRVTKLEWKLWAYRTGQGAITITGEKLDGSPGTIKAQVPNGYGDGGFQSTAIAFSAPGCWQVHYTMAGRDLSFTLEVQQ